MRIKPKKILHIIIGLNVGGAELMLKRLVLHSQKKGNFSHEIVSLTDLGIIGAELKKEDINVHTMDMTSFLSLPKTFVSLKKLIKELKPDVVQTWMYHADFIGGLAAKSLGIKKIIWGIRTTDVSAGPSKTTVFLRKICAWLSYSVPTHIVCAAEASRKTHQYVGYDRKKIVVIPNGFDIEKLKATEDDRKTLRKEIGILDHETVIGSIGRFNPVKNQKLFVQAAFHLNKKNSFLKFVIVGRDNNENNKQLMHWIDHYKLTEKFVLLGERKDICICLKAMDIFCLHSKTEGFPNTLGEAMAMGLPCVSTNVGDASYMLQNDSLIVEPEQPLHLAEALHKVIQLSERDRVILGDLAKNRVFDSFSLDQCVNHYENLY